MIPFSFNPVASTVWKCGGGYADTVTDKGWEGLEKHFAAGSEMLLKAWTLNKTERWAATQMISVSMAGGGKSDSPSDWFERSVNARFNQHSPYKQIRRKWDGRHRWDDSVFAQISGRGIAKKLRSLCSRY